MVKKHPFFVLFLKIDPKEIDVNIHPTKKNIRFNNESEILKIFIEKLRLVVEEKFGREKNIPITKKNEKKTTPTALMGEISEMRQLEEQAFNHYNEDLINSEESKKKITASDNAGISMKLDKMYDISQANKGFDSSPLQDKDLYIHERWIRTGILPDMKLINEAGQLNKTYIVLEGLDGFYLLDQHAAAERIKFEREMALYKTGKIKKQRLIAPIKFDVSINEKDFMDETLLSLKKYGFEIDPLGGTTFAIRAIPPILNKITNSNIIKDICMELISFGKQFSLEEEEEKVVKYIACHKSLRGGEYIDNPAKVKNLIENLSKCKNPHHCAHGRPTLLYISFNEIDKLFHRIN
jgi:DNA mismatch repair protein MutL